MKTPTYAVEIQLVKVEQEIVEHAGSTGIVTKFRRLDPIKRTFIRDDYCMDDAVTVFRVLSEFAAMNLGKLGPNDERKQLTGIRLVLNSSR